MLLLDVVDRDAILGRLRFGRAEIEFACDFVLDGRALHIGGLHVYGAGPNTLGIGGLRRAVELLMQQLDVDEVTIQGADRVTGATQSLTGAGRRTPQRPYFRREP